MRIPSRCLTSESVNQFVSTLVDHCSSRILRQEGHADVFVLRSWSPGLDLYDEEEYDPLDNPRDIVNVRLNMRDEI